MREMFEEYPSEEALPGPRVVEVVQTEEVMKEEVLGDRVDLCCRVDSLPRLLY